MVCPGCGRENSEEASYCIACGRALAITCAACATRNPLDASFCAACGRALGEGAEQPRVVYREVYALRCPRCHAPNEADSRYCVDCGFPLEESTAIPYQYSPYGTSLQAWSLGRPAGFWIRAVAALIDSVLLLIATAFFTGVVLEQDTYSNGTASNTLNPIIILGYGILMVAVFSGTVGKLLLGMRIVRTDGSRVSLGRATLRYFAQLLSIFTLLIGYVMVAFRKDKRSLHDLVADTVVIIVRN